MTHQGWTEAQLEAMTPAEREQIFADGFVYDLRDVEPELARKALDLIRVTLAEA